MSGVRRRRAQSALFAMAAAFMGGQSPSVAEAAGECLAWGRVALTGHLRTEVFPGPPNYESVASGDSAETALLLVLDEPICFAAGATPDDPLPAIGAIREIQVVARGGQRIVPSKGAVTISGRTSPARTGHHHTSAMLFEATVAPN